MKKELFIYHYHATGQTKNGFESTYDGIIETKKAIDSMEEYTKIKDWIAIKNPEYIRESIAITSLNLLNKKSS